MTFHGRTGAEESGMTKHDCVICCGTSIIRLPVRRRFAVAAPETISMDEVSRIYPCPECAATIPQERLAIVHHHSLADSRIDDPAYIMAARESAAHGLVEGLLEGGFIQFERGHEDARERVFQTRATVGVVSPKHVATLEERIDERQADLANKLAIEAKAQIRIWGAYYTGDEGKIAKGQAADAVDRALKAILATITERAKKRGGR